ncbi:MAG: SDR family NAD(P)-dependent oxidoreductase, partial [Ignavibacteria bacterium]|nr:SDR family NAD(P)-dependent oxidoreductase [Ignavibacteria bacterium]
MKSLKGKIAFITGASSGIGEATAKLFAREGAGLILVARRNTILQKLSKKIKNEFNVEVKTIQLDIQNYKSVLSAYNKLPAEWKAIDILVNNAGLSRG